MTKRLVLLWVFLHILTIGYAQEAVDSASDLVAQVQSILDEEEPDLDLALELANEAIELDPELASAYNWRAEVLFMIDSTRDEVLEDYEKAVELDPTYAEAIKNIGVWYANVAEDSETALSYYEQAIEADPDYYPAYVEIGLLEFSNQDYEAAIDNMTTAIDGGLGGNYGMVAYNIRAIANGRLGLTDLAIADYSSAIEIMPDDPVLYSNRGYSYEVNSQYDLALADYTNAIDLDPESEFYRYYRARVNVQLGDDTAALEDYTAAIDIYPEYVNALWGRGRVYERRFELDLAIADYSAAIEINNTAAILFADRGRVYAFMQVYDEAIADYTRAIELEPDTADHYAKRAQVYQNMGDAAAAYADLTRAIELEPDNQSHYFARIANGTPAQQVEDYTTLLEQFDPESVGWVELRAKANIQAGDPTAAFLDFDLMEELGADSDWVYELRGDAYAEIGAWGEAIESFAKAIELDPNFSDRIHLDLAEMYLMTGDLDQAEAEIQLYRDQSGGITFGRDMALEAILQVQRGQLDVAEETLTELRSNVRGFIFLLQADATLRMAQGDFEQALTLLDEAMAIEPVDEFGNVRVDTIIQMMRAETHFNLGNGAEAIINYDAILTRSADFIPALIGKARVLIDLEDDLVSAQPLLERVRELDPENADALELTK